MDYKDKYEKAVQAAMLAKQDTESAVTIGILEEIFPELRESEDEKIRKELIKETKGSEVRLFETVTNDEFIAWLEKQGEQKPVEPQQDMLLQEKYAKAVDECIYGEQKPADRVEPKDYNSIDPHFGKSVDKVEPKFKIGDIIIKYSKTPCQVHSSTDDTLCIVASVLDEHYILVTNEGKIQVSFALQDYYELVQPKQEWSEDDYNAIETIACHLDNTDNEGLAEVLRNIRDKYYHIIPQSTWKPSEEQMKALKHASNDGSIAFADMKILATLYEQLKALHRYEQDT